MPKCHDCGSLNPFYFRAGLLLRYINFVLQINGLEGAFRVFRGMRGVVSQRVASEAECGFLADVQPLAEMQGGKEGGKVAAQGPATDDAAELHRLLLAR